MRFRAFLILLLLALTGGMLVLLRPGGVRSADSTRTMGATNAPARPERSSPLAPAQRLRALPSTPLERAPSFEQVEEWTRDLSPDELLTLIEETGMDDHTGLTGWLRCALFAEWGRRDHEAAKDYLHALEWPGGNFHYAVSQSWFSLYRGWGESDPDAARLQLESSLASSASYSHFPGARGFDERAQRRARAAIYSHFPGARGFDERAQRRARAAIYRYLVEHHPDDPWKVAALTPGGPLDSSVMKAVLTGGMNPEQLQPFVNRWVDEYLLVEETTKALRSHAESLNSSFTGFIPIPAQEVIVHEIALTFAEGNIEDALTWLEETDPGIQQLQMNRVYNVHNDWARRHPQEAIERIAVDLDPDRNKVLAYGAFAGDPTLGPEIMRLFPEANDRWDIIFTAMSEGSNYHEDDFYPAPGQPNRLRDFGAAYETTLATVDAADLPPERKADLLKRVHKEFAHKVPAAAENAGE